jgi:hypothetical protein
MMQKKESSLDEMPSDRRREHEVITPLLTTTLHDLVRQNDGKMWVLLWMLAQRCEAIFSLACELGNGHR